MPDETLYAFGDFRLDAGRRLLSHRGERTIPLASRATDTLLFLVRNPGRLVTKSELMDAVWGDAMIEENNLTQTISTLRQALGEQPDEHRFIVTVSGHGYRFIANVTHGVRTPDATGSAALSAAPPRWRRRALIALAVAGLAAVVAIVASLKRMNL